MSLGDSTSRRPVALTIAGSDSGGGAGIQADLLTFQALGVFGTTAITCVTAQNPQAVTGVTVIGVDMIRKQIRAVCDAFPVAAAKTGMLFSADIVRAVASADVRQGIPILVVDPVMVSASGACLMENAALAALFTELFPQARLLTPNIPEAFMLCGFQVNSLEDMKMAAREIGDRFDTACVIKGGDLEGSEVVDFLYDEGEEFVFRAPRLPVASAHGAGCAFSAAITAFLARGELLSDAVGKAKEYVHDALSLALETGRQRPMNFLDAGLRFHPSGR